MQLSWRSTGRLRYFLFPPRLAFLAGLVLSSLIPAVATAQVADATIEVVVVDESRAVLPGVTVTATRPETGFTQSTVSDDTGTARIIALQPGTP